MPDPPTKTVFTNREVRGSPRALQHGPNSCTLLFQHPSRKVARASLRTFLCDAAVQIAGERAIVCLISGDVHLRALNHQFLGKDYPTDVLSFPGVEGGGEMAISLDAAIRQAEELGHTVEEELRILILHGILHLTGLDHETDSGEMARAETRWRKRFGLGAGLIERTQGPKKVAP